jgi:hypothetical protein
LGERLLCKQEVIGSIPFTSTTDRRESQRQAQRDALAFGLRATAVSLFNNSEEAKRIDSLIERSR